MTLETMKTSWGWWVGGGGGEAGGGGGGGVMLKFPTHRW